MLAVWWPRWSEFREPFRCSALLVEGDGVRADGYTPGGLGRRQSDEPLSGVVTWPCPRLAQRRLLSWLSELAGKL